jgi:hypothetical protein
VVGWFGGGLLHKVDGCELKVTYSARSDALELSGELPKQREAYTLSAATTISRAVRPCICLYAHSFSLSLTLLVPGHMLSAAATDFHPAWRKYRRPVCVCQYISHGCFNMTLLPCRIKRRKCQLELEQCQSSTSGLTDCPLGQIRFTHPT